MVRVPRRRGAVLGAASLRDERARNLDEEGDESASEREDERQREDRDDDPEDLRHRHEDRVRDGGGSVLLAALGRAKPLADEGEAHNYVARDHDAVVEDLALVDGLEHRREPERQDDHTSHPHHREQSEEPVVGLEGRGEPREVDPSPDKREHREAEADDRRASVALGDAMGEEVPGCAERCREREVVEQLERGRGAALLMGVAAEHPLQPMAEAARSWLKGF